MQENGAVQRTRVRQAAQLRAQLAAVGPRHRGARIPAALRAAIIAHARAARGAGNSVRTIAGALGVASESVRRWTRSAPAAAPTLVPVQVVVDPPGPLASASGNTSGIASSAKSR